MSSTLFVHLHKLGNNLKVIDSFLDTGIQRMAVIKDEAYGHGLIPIAKYLEDKVEWLCVAELEEAVRLREAGIQKPLLVFEIPPIGKEETYKKHSITATLADLSVFERLVAGTDCHLNFDTGMGRLGMLPSEAEKALDKMRAFDLLKYTGIYTHFANADGDANPTVEVQLQRFQKVRDKFPENLMTHTCNSAGVLYHAKKGTFDAIRTGIALYGYAPGNQEIPALEPIAEWRSHLVQVKKLKKGDTVGYGSRWKAPKEGWLGIIPIGYSDGIFRSLSGKIQVEINGQLFPQVGTISMDYMAVFSSDSKLEEGEEVIVLRDGELSAKHWGKLANTISYEITTTIAQKVKRIYSDQ